MAWTKSKAGGFVKYTQTLDAAASDTICLAGSGALVGAAGDDITVATAPVAGGLNASYAYTDLDTSAANEVVTVPEGAHMLKVTDPGGGCTVTVYVSGNAVGQDTVNISGGIGADPS